MYIDELLNCLNKVDAAWRPIIEGRDAKIDQMGVFMESQLQLNAAFSSKFDALTDLAGRLSAGFDRIFSNIEGQVSIIATLRPDITNLQVQVNELDKLLKGDGTSLSWGNVEEKLEKVLTKDKFFKEMGMRLKNLKDEWVSKLQVERARCTKLAKTLMIMKVH